MKFNKALITACLLFSQGAAAETLYVSDELKIAMRSGDTNSHRIIKFITSGTRLEVLETNEEGTFKRVRLGNGKEGWVEASDLTSQPSARSQLASMQSRLDSVRASLGKREEELRQMRNELSDAEKQNNQLDRFNQDKVEELEKLKKVAARPVQLARDKQQLEVELGNVKSQLERVTNENEELRSDSMKEWFLIGGGVSLFSLFAGLIIPNFRWRKKRDSWGDF